MNAFPKLGSMAKVNGAATVGEAYLVKEFIYDGTACDSNVKKFINTGGIDPYKSTHGEAPIRYLKGSYQYPLVRIEELQNMSDTMRANQKRLLLEV